MKIEIKKAINRHIPLSGLIKALITTMFIFFFMYSLINISLKAYEGLTPDEYRVDYSDGVDPIKDIFIKGEDLVFQSNNTRKRQIDVYREDTPYYILKDGSFLTGRTQYWPKEGTKRVGPRVKENIVAPWPYSIHIPINAIQAKMCGYIIGYTPRYKYEKTDFYCTNWFGVNGHSVNEYLSNNY